MIRLRILFVPSLANHQVGTKSFIVKSDFLYELEKEVKVNELDI